MNIGLLDSEVNMMTVMLFLLMIILAAVVLVFGFQLTANECWRYIQQHQLNLFSIILSNKKDLGES